MVLGRGRRRIGDTQRPVAQAGNRYRPAIADAQVALGVIEFRRHAVTVRQRHLAAIAVDEHGPDATQRATILAFINGLTDGVNGLRTAANTNACS